MKKSLLGPIISVIVLVLVGAMFVYFYISLNRMEKKVMEAQTMIAENSGQIQGIINLFNSSQAPQ